jgi:hypothetical protein
MSRNIVFVTVLGVGVAWTAADQPKARASPEVVLAQQVPVLGQTRQVPAAQEARSHTAVEIGLSVGVLVFGILAMGMQILVMLRQNRYWDVWSIKIVGLTLVISSGLFLIVAGYSQDQVAPMMGILGTVVGYLLGKDDSPTRPGGPPVSA